HTSSGEKAADRGKSVSSLFTSKPPRRFPSPFTAESATLPEKADIPVEADLPFPFPHPNQIETGRMNVREIPEPLQRTSLEAGHANFQDDGMGDDQNPPPGWSRRIASITEIARFWTSV